MATIDRPKYKPGKIFNSLCIATGLYVVSVLSGTFYQNHLGNRLYKTSQSSMSQKDEPRINQAIATCYSWAVPPSPRLLNPWRSFFGQEAVNARKQISQLEKL